MGNYKINPEIKAASQAIVSIFETGTADKHYGKVTLLKGDSGHLTYGYAQTTLASGNLGLLLNRYINARGKLSNQIKPYIGRVINRDLSLDRDMAFRSILKKAGTDEIMQIEQERFFDDIFWNPAADAALALGAKNEIGIAFAIVFDSFIHGSWKRIRARTLSKVKPDINNPLEFFKVYVSTRKAWLAGHSNRLLRRTVYRMDAFQSLFSINEVDLLGDYKVRTINIASANLIRGAMPLVSAIDETDQTELVLMVTKPNYMSGPYIRYIQLALCEAGFITPTTGVYDENTAKSVVSFQKSRHVTSDGIVGPVTKALLLVDENKVG